VQSRQHAKAAAETLVGEPSLKGHPDHMQPIYRRSPGLKPGGWLLGLIGEENERGPGFMPRPLPLPARV
jgi:hypothetical protein